MGQMDITIFAKAGSISCWRTKQLLRRRGYAFEVLDVAGDLERRAWLAETAGCATVPQVFVDGRLVGGFKAIRALDRAADLDRLLRGEV